MISMDDVAVKAGVSKATVSRVLNGKNPVSPKARKKVLTACKSLNYRMNANIQDLILKSRNGFTRNLAFVMVDVSFPILPILRWWILLRRRSGASTTSCRW